MLKPKKSLGQNFLQNSEIVSEIINAASIQKTDRIIEIGPGLGVLTDALVKSGAQIFAIEKDFDLVERLRKGFQSNKNLKIIHQDALFFNLETFENYKVVANLPFNVATPLIRKFLESDVKPELMVLMVQKEVAERLTAKPGSRERSILTILVEYYAEAEIIIEVSKTNFRPQPKVDAAVVKIKPKSHFQGGILVDEKLFFRIVKAGFSSKRQQIHNSLAATLRLDKNIVQDILQKSKIDSKLRAEDLTLEDWFRLSENLKNQLY